LLKASLEDSSDDKSSMQLVGLLLFKYYREQALEPFLKLLCSSGLKCRDEAAFEVSKAILWKIVQRHSACFQPAISFYAVNIDILDERGTKYFGQISFIISALSCFFISVSKNVGRVSFQFAIKVSCCFLQRDGEPHKCVIICCKVGTRWC
jgi:hypothetical protein